MPAKKLKRFLDENHVRYVSIRHSPAYTAQETAASAHVPGRELAKTVMLYVDGEMAMAVLPSTRMLDLELLRHQTKRSRSRLPRRTSSKIDFRIAKPVRCPPSGTFIRFPSTSTAV